MGNPIGGFPGKFLRVTFNGASTDNYRVLLYVGENPPNQTNGTT